ncbi:hypothetical protein N7535_009489 [Penicillium sp. DV-2018c]|nr:hypothetical protein N7461_001968 [Penicillium sp. DV-2018c]KAJ5559261.1 hypothetical protein N7535_009489 [Penicillium sp. DV-2018c]
MFLQDHLSRCGHRTRHADLAYCEKSASHVPGWCGQDKQNASSPGRHDAPASRRTGARTKGSSTLVTIEPNTPAKRLEPYARAICATIPEISTTNVPRIEPTATEWAVVPSESRIRDILVAPNSQAVLTPPGP